MNHSIKQNIPFEDRFWLQVSKTESCWIWTSAKFWNGYGGIRKNGKRIQAHRASWILFNGEIPDGSLVLHRCDNPACVNPDHLYLGDQKQNAKDRDSRGRNGYSNRTHCKKGHEFNDQNTYRYKGKRLCKICRSKLTPRST